MPPVVFVFLLRCGSAAPQDSPAPDSRAQDSPALGARAQFLANCAVCHGETGDGQGTTTLDRPARSFRDGGFSYGNTPEALFRTISMGIPGTPMPGFDLSLDEAQRRALAEYVISLGPEIREVTEAETLLVVRDRPLVVRGKLPPIVEDAVERPRGLLLGTTDGFSFEYRADDVRLLGVRQGDFVRRSDWSGRGGTGLEPLGKLVFLVEGGDPEPLFTLHPGEVPLRARLAATRIRDGRAAVAYRMVDETDRELALVEETPRAISTGVGTGFVRRLEISAEALPVELWVRVPGRREDGTTASFPPSSAQTTYSVVRYWDASIVCTALFCDPPAEERHRSNTGEIIARLRAGDGAKTALEITVLVLPEWSDAVASKLEEILER